MPSRNGFLARGRLLVAPSGDTVVPEAESVPGDPPSRYAHALRRGVDAVPGPASAVSQGSNDIIKRGVASMVTESSDVTRMLESGQGDARALRAPSWGRTCSLVRKRIRPAG